MNDGTVNSNRERRLLPNFDLPVPTSAYSTLRAPCARRRTVNTVTAFTQSLIIAFHVGELSSQPSEWTASVFWTPWVQIPTQKQTILTENVRGFPHYLQTNAGIVT
jgi:hypothetical protein